MVSDHIFQLLILIYYFILNYNKFKLLLKIDVYNLEKCYAVKIKLIL